MNEMNYGQADSINPLGGGVRQGGLGVRGGRPPPPVFQHEKTPLVRGSFCLRR